MSSTNRGYNRHKSDYYITPQIEIEKFLYCFQYDILQKSTEYMQELKYLDPCCGGDAQNEASYLSVLKEYYEPDNIIGIDIRKDSKADIYTDYLNFQTTHKYDIIISNPPFYLAEDFIAKSLKHITKEGYVIMLLRLNFFGSKKRKKLFENNMPKYCFVHHKRISFNKISTDSIEYAHFVWVKDNTDNFCKTFVI